MIDALKKLVGVKCIVRCDRSGVLFGKVAEISEIKALNDKIFENMDTDEKIAKFIETFDATKRYKGQQFYDWHHLLTGSCEMGRQSFIRNKGLSLDAEYTVAEFIAICENDYGENIIRELKEKLGL